MLQKSSVKIVKINRFERILPEFFALKSDCKYHNCIHKDEPECAVKLAMNNKDVAQSRYKNYLKMLEEDKECFRMNNY